jgi:endoglucanase
VYMLNSSDTDRVFWYNGVRNYLQQNNISWTIWDYRGGFGLYKKNSDEMFQYDLNIPLVAALGFSVPSQSVYVQKPDTTAITLYSDYPGPNIINSSYTTGMIDFYSDQSTYEGKYCIYWYGADQYQQIGFDFKPNKDLSFLKEEGYVFDCRVKGDAANTSFDIRFVDTKTNESNDHPWRMRYIINNALVPFNNEWQHHQIPLKYFSEQGAWDNNTWYDPRGLFDWKNIDRFEIVSEEMKLTANQLWFDDIKIFNPNAVSVAKNNLIPFLFELEQNYPNPFNPATTISFNLSSRSFVSLKIFDALGREVVTLISEALPAGKYSRQWKAEGKPSGVYFYRMQTGTFTDTKKLVLLR